MPQYVSDVKVETPSGMTPLSWLAARERYLATGTSTGQMTTLVVPKQ